MLLDGTAGAEAEALTDLTHGRGVALLPDVVSDGLEHAFLAAGQ